jgi:Rrf2 family protein
MRFAKAGNYVKIGEKFRMSKFALDMDVSFWSINIKNTRRNVKMLSLRSHYGLMAIVVLAANHGKGYIQAKQIAFKLGIHVRYLESLLVRLRRARMVNSIRGKNGGYILSKNPSQISVWDTINVFEGKVILMEFDPLIGRKKTPPIYVNLWDDAEKLIAGHLKSITVSSLVNQIKTNA